MILKSPAENRFPIALKQVIIQKMISGLSLRLSVKAKRINANDVRIEMFLIKRIILAVLMLSQLWFRPSDILWIILRVTGTRQARGTGEWGAQDLNLGITRTKTDLNSIIEPSHPTQQV